ncbi:FG-GAP repeat domain-containing protein [candidate division KSB1 bacterium]
MKTKLLILITVMTFTVSAAFSQQTVFEEVTEDAGLLMNEDSKWSTGMAWGDFNNDGLVDVYVTSWGQASTGRGENALYQNLGSGVFANVASTYGLDLMQNSVDAAWADFDNDGDLDLFVANYAEGDMVFQNYYKETGESTILFIDVTATTGFVNESIGLSTSAVWGDYDNDGFLDIYVTKFSGRNALYKNNGGTSFTLLDGEFGDVRDSENARWTDYDNDGDVDLYVVNREQENRLFENDNGTLSDVFGDLNDTQFGRYAVWADFDDNNLLDLFLGNIGANSLYTQTAAGIFSEIADGAGVKSAPNSWDTWGATWGDYDLDGDQDLFFVGGFAETDTTAASTGTLGNILLENNGGVFTDKTLLADLSRGALKFPGKTEVGSFASAASFADFDNDGDLDIFITNTYRNLCYKNMNNPDNYLKIRVKGKGAGFNNINGLGAKVRVYNTSDPGQVIAMREITSGPEPMSALFGLQTGETYNIEVSFLKNGSTMPDPVVILNVSVPKDTLIIQH